MQAILYWLYFIFAVVAVATVAESGTVQKKKEPLINLCPLSGNVGTKFDVEVLGTEIPQISGNAFKQRKNRIDIRLENKPCDVVEHITFDCVGAWHAKSEEDNKVSEFIYITFFDRMYYKKGYSKYRCAMYAQKENSTVLNLAINENEDCSGLKERLLKTTFMNITETLDWMNGFLLLHLSPKLEVTLQIEATENTKSVQN